MAQTWGKFWCIDEDDMLYLALLNLLQDVALNRGDMQLAKECAMNSQDLSVAMT
jgi:hypothetical protein